MFCTSSQPSRTSISLNTLRAASSSTGTVIVGTREDSAESYSMPASCNAVRTVNRSVGSLTTSNESPRSLISSAPASSTASIRSSSDSPALGTITTPLRLNRYDTLPASAKVPPLRVSAVRTSVAARLRLSVRHSISIATPFGPYPSYMIVCQSAPPASSPEPRLTARSMLSLGTELFFAFWMASYSVGFPAGSPPPTRAATSTFLISLANILPRLASMTAFLCLVVAHLEWPDMVNLRRYPSSSPSADHLDEVPMDAQVAGELRVECRGKQVPLLNGDNSTGGRAVADAPHHLDFRADVLDPRRPDENGVERPAV